MLSTLLVLAALVLAAIAFLAAVVSGFTAPAWVLPTAVLCLAAGVALGGFNLASLRRRP